MLFVQGNNKRATITSLHTGISGTTAEQGTQAGIPPTI